MKIAALLTFAVLFGTVANEADPEGFALWKGKSVTAHGQELSSKIDDQGFAWYSLADYDNHLLGISHREKDGSAELHQTQTDVMIVQEGTATLIVGGTMLNAKEVKPNEVRGSGIQGGEEKQVGPGDIIHIPAKIPHQLKIKSGEKFTYLVMKVDIK